MDRERFNTLRAEFKALLERYKKTADRNERVELMSQIAKTLSKTQVLLNDLYDEVLKSRSVGADRKEGRTSPRAEHRQKSERKAAIK